jgi:3-hydroxyacyl-CoA dehydrogenase
VYLVAEGVADVEDVDTIMSNGPGLRLALLGPHMNYHLGGGEGGYRSYLEHLGPSQEVRWETLGQTPLTHELKEKLIQGIESQNPNMTELKTKRDSSLIKILKTKKENKL